MLVIGITLCRSPRGTVITLGYLVAEHDGPGHQGAAVVHHVYLARHAPLLQQQVSIAAQKIFNNFLQKS